MAAAVGEADTVAVAVTAVGDDRRHCPLHIPDPRGRGYSIVNSNVRSAIR